tara:strand:+ start:2955 stop:4499 length:1545 start_codon:yes stop_codon:yes gene_type:complete
MTTPLATSNEMSNIDFRAINDYGIPSDVLMDRAGKVSADEIWKRYGKDDLSVTIICGKGNNGGDGYVVAKYLFEYGVKVTVLRIVHSKSISKDSSKFLEIISNLDIEIIEVGSESLHLYQDQILSGDIIVDAILGSGSKKRKGSVEEKIISLMSDCEKDIVSLDLPSGVDATTGECAENHFISSLTISFGLLKRAHIILPSSELSKEIINVDIGIPQKCIDEEEISLNLINLDDVSNILHNRPTDSHKGKNGNVLVIGGSSGMIGAPILTAMGAYRTGAGKVTICIPEQEQQVHQIPPEIICKTVKTTEKGCFDVESMDILLRSSEEVDVVVIGPGISTNPRTNELVQLLLRYVEVPMVIDADAINCIAQDLTILENHTKEIIISPHPGEMARLIGTSTNEIQNNRVGLSSSFALDNNLTLVLKGWGTIISNNSGKSWINTTGNSGMSVAGMGDVLAGMIGAFKSQKQNTLDSCIAAVFLHGYSGDIAAKSIGKIGIIPSDLIECIPFAREEIS